MVNVSEPAPQSSTESAQPSTPRAAPPLTRFIRYEALRRLQERFSRLAQVSTCICGVHGEPITTPTWGSRYSQLIGNSTLGRLEWRDALRAVCSRPPPKSPPICHGGITLYAAPISHQRQRIAHVIVGIRESHPPPRDEMIAIAERFGIESAALIEAAEPEYRETGGTPEHIREFADLLAGTIATLYAQADLIGEQLADLRVVHGLAELLAGTTDLQQILDTTVRQVVEVMPVKACAIRLLDEATGELVVKAVHNLSEEYLNKGPVLLQQSIIDSSAFAGHAVYIEDARIDPRIRYKENAVREGIVSGLCVPLTFRGRTIGVMRVYTGEVYRFSKAEEQLLRSIGSQAAAAVITTQLYQGRAEADRVKRQVEAAGQIQRRMLPSKPVTRKQLAVGGVYDPTLQVGGDFYDFVEWDDGSLGVCVADVSGKGLPAALMMASVRSSLRAHSRCTRGVGVIVGRVNQDMCHDALISEFATVFFGAFEPDERTLWYCNAGHLPPLLLRGGTFTELDTGGLVVGVNETETFDEASVRFEPGDALVLFTDGVTDAMNFDGKPYGMDRFRESILRHRELDAQALAKQLLWDVRRYAGLADQTDDITIVVVRAV